MRLVIMSTHREPSTIQQTLASVFASGWDGPVTISTDPESAKDLADLEHHSRVDVDRWQDADWTSLRGKSVNLKAGRH